VEAWIALSRGGRVAAIQREAWRAWGIGESGLIYAPTGSGKTLAALGGPMIEANARGVQTNEGLSLLWVRCALFRRADGSTGQRVGAGGRSRAYCRSGSPHRRWKSRRHAAHRATAQVVFNLAT
jgi:hypothetical protein